MAILPDWGHWDQTQSADCYLHSQLHTYDKMNKLGQIAIGKMPSSIFVDEVIGEIQSLQFWEVGFADIEAAVTCYLIVVYLLNDLPRWSMTSVEKYAPRKYLRLSHTMSLEPIWWRHHLKSMPSRAVRFFRSLSWWFLPALLRLSCYYLRSMDVA